MDELVKKILSAKRILLSTHRQCDGDGLGAQLAVFHALKKNKNVFVVNVDSTPRKYRYLNPDSLITYFEEQPQVDLNADLCLIFDTNDERLIEPLYSQIKSQIQTIAFIDHHPVLKEGPHPSIHSVIDTSCASTGEMAYHLIKKLQIPLDRDIARCLYTSITFDTQLYRYIRNSPMSHIIAAELLQYNIEPEDIHRYLFGHHTINKIAFLAKTLGQIEYYSHGQLAILKFSKNDLLDHHLDQDDSRDVIDMIMNIETLEAAAIFREDSTDEYKMSLRSKGKMDVLSIAESMGGGGHAFAAGAYIKEKYDLIHKNIMRALLEKIDKI